MRRVSLFIAALTAISCGLFDPAPKPTTVQFVLDAPLCSSIIPVRLSIDKAIVAIDTFYTLGVRREESARFPVSPGPHGLSAQVITSIGTGFVWPETLVTVQAGQAYRHSLPFYCS